jgi:hypothetical protein
LLSNSALLNSNKASPNLFYFLLKKSEKSQTGGLRLQTGILRVFSGIFASPKMPISEFLKLKKQGDGVFYCKVLGGGFEIVVGQMLT